MKLHALAGLTASLATFAHAACRLENMLGPDEGGFESRPELCTQQDPGNYQLALDVSEVGVPTFDGGNAFAGVTGNNIFLIYDSGCNRLGAYAPSGNDCGVPYEIDFLGVGSGNLVVTIHSVNFDVGSPNFSFYYADQDFTANGGGCGGCGDLSQGLYAEQACKCKLSLP